MMDGRARQVGCGCFVPGILKTTLRKSALILGICYCFAAAIILTYGHKPFQGKRLAVQMNWAKSERYRAMEHARHVLSAWIKKFIFASP
jgi:hypothetical protein